MRGQMCWTSRRPSAKAAAGPGVQTRARWSLAEFGERQARESQAAVFGGKGMAGTGMYGTGIQAVMPESVRVRLALPLLAPPNARLTVAAGLNPQSPTFAQNRPNRPAPDSLAHHSLAPFLLCHQRREGRERCSFRVGASTSPLRQTRRCFRHLAPSPALRPPTQPGFGGSFHVASDFARNGALACDCFQRPGPVIRLAPQFSQNQRHRTGPEADDLLVWQKISATHLSKPPVMTKRVTCLVMMPGRGVRATAKYYVQTQTLRLVLDAGTARDAAVRADPVVPRPAGRMPLCRGWLRRTC